MTMTPEQYIEAKKSAMAAKTGRKVWLDGKINSYRLEREDVEAVLRRDAKVLVALEGFAEEFEEKSRAIERAREIMNGLTGKRFDDALIGYMNAKTALEDVEARMRAVYYAK